MGATLLTTLSSLENYHASTLLSMDSGSFTHEESERQMNRSVLLSGPPDINLPLSSEASPVPLTWNEHCDILDVGLGSHIYEAEAIAHVPKLAKKYSKRVDGVWGAWFFFSFYFKPVLNEKSKCKISIDSKGLSGYEKSDLQLDAFLVQHDMENMYMWVFKEKPENALGKMQLRSFMNGHSRQGEQLFPFSVDKGFVRSHRMQRKHYRGLSNPQCLHGIELVRSPNLSMLDENEKKKWMELTGRDMNFCIPQEASDYSSWRNHPNPEFEPENHRANGHHPKKLNGTGLNLSRHSPDSTNDATDAAPICSNKRKKESSVSLGHGDESCSNGSNVELPWTNNFSGVMTNMYGPVTAAKSIYEDEQGFLIIISLPLVDLETVKVTWRNTASHSVVKVTCVSIGCVPYIRRHGRTFKLTDPVPEHCQQGEFVREIALPIRIAEEAKLEAYRDETGTMLEIMVPKQRIRLEEHEVRVCLRPFALE